MIPALFFTFLLFPAGAFAQVENVTAQLITNSAAFVTVEDDGTVNCTTTHGNDCNEGVTVQIDGLIMGYAEYQVFLQNQTTNLSQQGE